ncbi:hypothetical protein [Achromobacter aloeverae]
MYPGRRGPCRHCPALRR